MDRRLFLAGLGALCGTTGSTTAWADGALSLLVEPRTHVIMRHALAPGTGDPATFALRECGTQRNLDSRGREQARATGAMLRDAGVRIDAVLSSQWCRCLDTARLLDLAPVEEEPALNSFFSARSRAGAQTAAVIERLASTPEDRTFMLVTHFVNVRALLGETTTSGEMVIFRLERDGTTTIRDTVLVPA
ncbi:MAG: histidine phosphatase family protein [Pseudomonadota bacterium]